MSFPVISPNLCVFCYKQIPPENCDDQNRAKVTKFCATLTNFLSGKNCNQRELLPSCSFDCCDDCEKITSQVSDLYQEIKCLELHLFWKLERLSKIMNFSDKLPSRVTNMKQSFKVVKIEGGHIVPNNGSVEGDLEAFRQLRSKIKRKCDHGRQLSRLQPRVSLKRLDLNAVITVNPIKEERSDELPLDAETATDILFSSSTEDPLYLDHLFVDDNSQDAQQNDPLNIDSSQETITADPIECKIKTETCDTEMWIEDGNDLEDTYSNTCTTPFPSMHDPNINKMSDSTEAFNKRQRKDSHQNIRNGQISWVSPSESGDTVKRKNPTGQQKPKRKVTQISSSKTKHPFACLQCGTSFKKKQALQNHSEYHKNPEEWKYECTTCGKKSPNKQHLLKHMVVHSDEKPFKCDKCGKGFKLKESLKLHLVYHENPEDWKNECSSCGKKFAHKQHLKVHLDKKACKVLKGKSLKKW